MIDMIIIMISWFRQQIDGLMIHQLLHGESININGLIVQ
jgi:hypothetical protein